MGRIFALTFLFTVLNAYSAIPVKKTTPVKPVLSSQTIQRQIGGQAGAGFTLLGLQKIQSKNGKAERIIFEIGTKEGQALLGLPGYFNAQNQIRPNRIVLDFSQMGSSRVDENFVRAILKDSGMISNVQMTSDPSDKTLSLILDLRNSVKMKTLQVAGKKQTAKVVLDIIKQ